MAWNGENGLFVIKKIEKLWEEKIGDASDINLMLIGLLRAADLNVYPMVLSTRQHGYIPLTRPTINSMNYVVACVEIQGEQLLLDATDPYIAPNVLPVRCLNGKGRVIKKSGSTWVNLKPEAKHETIVQYEVSLSEKGLSGRSRNITKKYAAYERMRTIDQFESIEKYVHDKDDENEMISIIAHEIDTDNPYKGIDEKYELTIEDGYTQAGDLIYLNPMLDQALNENPFKLENRTYPVEYAYPIKETYVFKMPIPEGYTIEYIPEKSIISLVDNGGKYTYTSNTVNDVISIIGKFELKQLSFLPTEYQGLREFYDLIIEKQREQIVLRKLE